MKRTIKYTISSFMLVITLSFTNPAGADSFTLPAGLACPDFDLTIEITPNDHRVFRVWEDANGNPVRMLEAGIGADLNFINENTGASFSTKANGSVTHTTVLPDESLSVSAEGHNVIILFPTDLPQGVGPSTKQYIGRVVYTVHTEGEGENAIEIWTLQSFNGRTVDVCAALS